MSGETNLRELLSGMQPVLHDAVYLFVTIAHERQLPPSLAPVMLFEEREGRTLIIEEGAATSSGLAGTFRCRMITLEIHSSLEAVGFLAAVTTRLAAAGIGVNPVSAFYHDHLFVPEDRAEEALALLQELARDNRL